MKNLKQQALAYAITMSQGLYGAGVGSSFHAVTSREILLEAIRFIIADIREFIAIEGDPTIRETIYPFWYNAILKSSEGVFSNNLCEQNRALRTFFTCDRIMAFKRNDGSDYYLEGLSSVRLNQVVSNPDEVRLDRCIAKPYRELGFIFHSKGILDETSLSVREFWSQIHVAGNRDRVGTTVRYEFA